MSHGGLDDDDEVETVLTNNQNKNKNYNIVSYSKCNDEAKENFFEEEVNLNPKVV